MPIRYDTDAHVVVITIDRPEAMNALDEAHNAELADAFGRYEADPALRAAVLIGAGRKAFSAGADLRQMLPTFRDAVRRGEEPPWIFGGITAEAHLGKPRIAAVNGHALAGGLEMALACDIRLASPNATFGLAETKLAITPGAGGSQRLARLIPLGAAMEMVMSANPIGAEDALRWGLVNRVVPQDELLDSAVRLAHDIAARGPLAVRAAREVMLRGLSLGLEDGLAAERGCFLQIMRTQDALEGSEAFLAKRAPVYQGL